MLKRKPYPTDLNDTEWEKIRLLLPKPNASPRRGRPTKVDYREILNALRYMDRAGCAWDLLPHDFPPSDTVFYYHAKWAEDGTWKRMYDTLFLEARAQSGRSAEPTLGIIDSQSVKTTIESGEHCGYDGGKQVKGRKRHAVVDILGNLLGLKVHDADIQDRDGAQDVLLQVFQQYPSIEKILADGAYSGDELADWIKRFHAEVEIVRKLKDQVGFVVQAIGAVDIRYGSGSRLRLSQALARRAAFRLVGTLAAFKQGF